MTVWNFGGLEEKYFDYGIARYIINPVPYDKTCTWHRGQDAGPSAIMQASQNMELYDCEKYTYPYKAGIYTITPPNHHDMSEISPEDLWATVEDTTHQILTHGKIPITIGGEHSIAVGAIQRVCDHIGDVTVLHLDAHTDMREEYEGEKLSHMSTHLEELKQKAATVVP